MNTRYANLSQSGPSLDPVELLIEGRRLHNQTVNNANEVAAWRRSVDTFLTGKPGDDHNERYDTPRRDKARKFVNSLFRK